MLISSAGCKTEKSSSNELVIGVEGISRAYDPFYIESEADSKITSQIFQTVQRKNSNNKLVDWCGGISYELIGESQVLYTVTLKENMFFSNGKNVTVDDLIFFFHYISDASYDGYYKDWYLNDIVGLKEYRYDDVNYLSEINNIESSVKSDYTLATISDDDFIDYLVETDVGGKYVDGVEITEEFLEYIDKYGFTEAYNDLGENPTNDEIVELIAAVENEHNRSSYDPESWYRNKLYGDYVSKNYGDGIDIPSITGIKKINDYSCTILFNSRNINAVSQINMPLVCRDNYIVDYVKGNTKEIKEKNIKPSGSGPYMFSKNKDDAFILTLNEYYYETKPEFSVLKFVNFEKNGKSPAESIRKKEVDIITVPATANNLDKLDSNKYHTVFFNNSYYTSMFINPLTLDITERKALAGLCDFNNYVRAEYANNYTRLTSPISIRFNEYPDKVTEPYYGESSFTAYSKLTDSMITSLSAYYCGNKDDFEYGILEEYKKILADKNISLNIVLASEEELRNAVISGEADLWIENVPDGATCDKFEYYNSQGTKNLTGFSNLEIDMLTQNLRSAVGFSDKSKMVSQISELVMAQAIEMPLCQLQTVTVYRLDKISETSFDFDFAFDDFIYTVPVLNKK